MAAADGRIARRVVELPGALCAKPLDRFPHRIDHTNARGPEIAVRIGTVDELLLAQQLRSELERTRETSLVARTRARTSCPAARSRGTT
jgi:hypothetical protein